LIDQSGWDQGLDADVDQRPEPTGAGPAVPLCYAQIGGLAVATFITLLLVPVFYAIFVLDLKWITWEVVHSSGNQVERKADSFSVGKHQ